MSLEDLWNEFINVFKECINSKIEIYEERQFPGIFWEILWRLKDDTSSIHKISRKLHSLIESCYMLDSYRVILAIQVLSIIHFYEDDIFSRIFLFFIELVNSNELYVKHILFKNRLDSSSLWIIKQGPDIFPRIDTLLNECQEIWRNLSNPESYRIYPEEKAEKISRDFYNYFEVVSQFAEGLENYIDRLFKGSKRGEFPDDYFNISSFNIESIELRNQIETVNDLYKSKFYDVIPFKIRLVIEYMINKLNKWKIPEYKATIFFNSIKDFKKLFPPQKGKFPNHFDINRLHKLREWGNFTAHDIFPAISKEELISKKKGIIRIIKGLIKLNHSIF